MLAIKNVTLGDGSGAVVNMLLKDGVIAEIGPDAAIPCGCNVIDATGLYAIPGLIDAHTHFGGSASLTEHPGFGNRTETYNYTEAREGFLRWGVTAARSCGGYTEDILAVRDELRAGTLRGPRLFCACRFFQGVESHPFTTVYFRNPAVAEHAAIFVDDTTDIEGEMAKVATLGVDFIKAFYTKMNRMDYPNTVPQMEAALLKRIIDAAHNNGIKIGVHIDYPEDLVAVAEMGADNIEHMMGNGIPNPAYSDEDIAKIKASGATVVPTIYNVGFYEPAFGFPPTFEALKREVKRFFDAGITLGVGVDSGIPFMPHGESLHSEMAALADAGIPSLEILKMATKNNAKILGQEDKLGSLEKGKLADVVLLGSDPAQSIANAKDIKLVVLGGKIVEDFIG